MAFFNAYAAFENFVNTKSGQEQTPERLSDKFRVAFNNHQEIKDFVSCDSFTKLATALKTQKFESTRNDIAHGKATSVNWKSRKQAAADMYIFTSTIILCFEKGYRNFNEIRKCLKQILKPE